MRDQYAGTLEIVMRVYFEKPRTTVGWKGLINDPYLDESYRIDEGLRIARQLLIDINRLGLPAGSEFLDVISPQYIGALISWGAIGARTTESQVHRELASGLSAPIGFKNGTDGSLDAAINGVRSAMGPHHFLGVTEDGLPAVFSTTGNSYPHVVLRGGRKPNYDAVSIAACVAALRDAHLPQNLIVDCSHGNSGKKADRQGLVLKDVLTQIEAGQRAIRGFMLESNLEGGHQPMQANPALLNPRCSVTDECIDWPATEELLKEAHARIRKVIN